MELTKEQRILNALRCEKVDKTAFTCADTIVVGKIGNSEYVQGDNYTRPEWAMQQLIEGAKILDMDNTPSFEYAPGMTVMYTDGAENLTPGKELAPDVGTQVIEHNYMLDEAHYDIIIGKGWNYYFENYISCHWTDENMQEFDRMNKLNEIFAGKCAQAGLDSFDCYASLAPLDSSAYILSMQRGFSQFLKDCRKIPEKVDAAIKIMDNDLIGNFKVMTNEYKPLFGMGTLARMDNSAMSRKMFERFVWPSIMKCEKAAKEKDMIFVIHCDGNFEDDIDLICELTGGNTAIQHDGYTNNKKLAKGYRDNKICMWGDVPAPMLVLDTPENVYRYCMELKEGFCDGLIITAGCSYPPNSNLNNVFAMKKAADNMSF